jgi:CDP-glucose 4,6-dehydratase
VIGGGDWAEDRIIPDAMRALAAGRPVPVRNPGATRPWQHVLEPLAGYLSLAQALLVGKSSEQESNSYCSAFNFGPLLEANRSVRQLIEEGLKHWPGDWDHRSADAAPHEAGRLHLQIDKAMKQLNWKPRWTFATTVKHTVSWYRAVNSGTDPHQCCIHDLCCYQDLSRAF